MEDWRARRDAYVSVRHPLEVSGGPPKRQRAVQLSQGEDPVVPHSPTCIVHVDIDCFYAQVEMVREPSLRGKPIGIQQKYLLVTCNYEARKFGVTKLQSLADARRKCPHITILNGSTLTHYREASENIHRYLRSFTPKLRKLGMDETFIDVTELVDERLKQCTRPCELQFAGHVYCGDGGAQSGNQIDLPTSLSLCDCGCVSRLKTASLIASEMRAGLEATLGYTSCAGVSTTMLLAKLACELHKPNQQTVLLPQDGPNFVASLSVRKLPGCGFHTSKQLNRMKIETAEQLLKLPLPLLVQSFGERLANVLFKACRGLDHESLEPSSERTKSMSEEDSFVSCTDLDDAKQRIRSLLVDLLHRLDARHDDANEAPQTLRLTVRPRGSGYSGRISRQTVFPQVSLGLASSRNMEREEHILCVCMDLFAKLVQSPFLLTLLNVCASDFKRVHVNGIVQQISRFFPATPAYYASSLASAKESTSNVMPGGEADQSEGVVDCASPQRRQSSFETITAEDVILRCKQCGGMVRDQDAMAHIAFHESGAIMLL